MRLLLDFVQNPPMPTFEPMRIKSSQNNRAEGWAVLREFSQAGIAARKSA
jgi:hypothetical protein